MKSTKTQKTVIDDDLVRQLAALLDETGRLVLPPDHAAHAGISDLAVFVGQGNRFQIWAPERFKDHSEKARARHRRRAATLFRSLRTAGVVQTDFDAESGRRRARVSPEFQVDFSLHRNLSLWLLEALEGKRGMPRLKPPFPAVAGLYECPTVINNVETLACLPHIVNRGVEWFRGIGPEQSPGPKLYCLSGHVQKPGVYELPMGISLRELVDDHAGGARPGRKIKAVIPGGVSAPMIPESGLDVTMDFESLTAIDTMLGSAGVIVLDDGDCIVRAAKNINEFFHEESCGKCTPCREGTRWLYQIVEKIMQNKGQLDYIEKMEDICDNMNMKAFCPLADACVSPVVSSIKYFRSDYEEYFKNVPVSSV